MKSFASENAVRKGVGLADLKGAVGNSILSCSLSNHYQEVQKMSVEDMDAACGSSKQL
jgi:hypothetical protein